MAEQANSEMFDLEADQFTFHQIHDTNLEQDGFNVHLPPTLSTGDVHQPNITNEIAGLMPGHELPMQTVMQQGQTSHVRNHSDSSGSHSPREESSPYGSPGNQKNEAMTSTFGNEDHRRQNRLLICETGNYESRLATFDTWHHPTLDKEVLAEAGFYYLGESDTVYCSKCRRSLDNWEPNDDPRNEHFIHFGTLCF